MKCPSCGAATPEGSLECASCGVIFAKFAEKRKREREEAEAAVARMNVPPAPIVDPQLGRKIGFGVFFLWAAVMGFFIVKEVMRKHERRAAGANAPIVAAQPPAPVPGAAAALPAHAIVVDASGQMSTAAGEAVTNTSR